MKALLESAEIILRGEVHLRLPRSSTTDVKADGGTLVLTADGQAPRLELGGKEAEKWAAALLKPPPPLARKLGLGPDARALVLGDASDPELVRALNNAVAAKVADAAMVVAVIDGEAGLRAAVSRAPHLPVWCVYAKGKAAGYGDGEIRSFMRARGYRDNKSCAVSERLTATRYSPPK